MFTQDGHEYEESCKTCLHGKTFEPRKGLTLGYFLMRTSQLRLDLKTANGKYRLVTEVFKGFISDISNLIINGGD